MDADDIPTGGDGFEDAADILEDFEGIEETVEEDTNAADAGAVPPSGVTKESRATNLIAQAHPECRIDYVEDVARKLPVTNYPTGAKDPNHRSVPYLTQFERTKILGFRSNQLSQGARPLIEVPAHVTDVMEIARIELEQKRLPFLLKRPMPDGTYEYWRLQDLLVL